MITGILTQAQKAKNETENAARKEEEDLAKIEAEMNGTGIPIVQVTDEKPGELEQEDANTLVINSIEDLVFFSYDVTNENTYEGKTVKLGANLDFNSYVDPDRTDFDKYGYTGSLKQALTSGTGFSPIGELSDTGTKYFYGTFDGDNKAICSLYINIDRDENIRAGLFSTCYGEVKNLGLVNTNITVQGACTTVGSVAGVSYNNIYDCYATGSLNVTGNSWMPVGGITGWFCTDNTKIENCYNLANIECENILEGYGNADISCGGIAGKVTGKDAIINKCYNKGNIKTDGGENNIIVGGICGSLRKGTLKNSYNNAKIEGNSENTNSSNVNFGGICGEILADDNASLINCYNIGEVHVNGTDSVIIGGMTAYSRNNAEIRNTFNIGNLKGETKSQHLYAGGVLGMDDGTNISQSYNIGKLEADVNHKNIGGIIGIKFSGNTVDNCSYLAGTCNVGVGGNGSSAGITELDNISEFKSVLEVVNKEGAFKEDTNNINNGYPILAWQ